MPENAVPNTTDHDLLIELRAEMRGLRSDLKNMNDNVGEKVKDHEERIRAMENSVSIVQATKAASDRITRVGGAVFVVVVGIAEFVAAHYWH